MLKERRAEVEREKERAKQRTSEDQKFLSEATAERTQLFGGLSPRSAQAYDKIRRRWKGLAVADATEGRCSACQILLRPQHFQDLRHSEQLMFCESCGRILYYKPPVDLEHEIHSPR